MASAGDNLPPSAANSTPHPNPPPQGGRELGRVPKAALLALAVIAAGEVAFQATTEPLTGLPYLQPTADDAILTAKQKLIPKGAGRTVLVGDSSCTMGLQAKPLDAVNLGTILTMTPPGFADLTERACALDPPPARVVFAALPRSFEVTEAQAHEFELIGRYLSATGRSSPVYSPTARERWEWLVRKRRVNVFPPEFGGSYQQYERDLFAADGWYPERGRYVPKSSKERDAFQPTEFATAGLRRLAAVCREKGVPLTIWWSPAPYDSITERYAAEVQAFTDRLRPELPGVAFPRPTVPRWDASWFGSVTHVTPAGAEINTRELVYALK